MPLGQPIDVSKLTPGFRGLFYDGNGNPIFECKSWSMTRTHNNSNEQVLGNAKQYGVMQSYTDALTFDTFHIVDDLALEILDAVASSVQPSFRFIGEIQRPDGAVGRYVADNCVPDGDLQIAGANPGDTMSRTFNFIVNGDVRPINPLT